MKRITTPVLAIVIATCAAYGATLVAQNATGTARIQFTEDQKLSDNSLNGAVYAEKQLMLTAVAKDEAMSQADAGNYTEAAKILTAQNTMLKSAFANAPAGVQNTIDEPAPGWPQPATSQAAPAATNTQPRAGSLQWRTRRSTTMTPT